MALDTSLIVDIGMKCDGLSINFNVVARLDLYRSSFVCEFSDARQRMLHYVILNVTWEFLPNPLGLHAIFRVWIDALQASQIGERFE